MDRTHRRRLGLAAALCAAVLPAQANPLQVYTQNDAVQDDWTLSGGVDELGNKPPFPNDEWIESSVVPWNNHVPCPADYQGGGAVQVRITNRTGIDWYNGVYYVADPETSLSNVDEYVGQVGYPTPRAAFRIDAVGENTPLVSESIAADGVFQNGESWEFVIQEYRNSAGGPADKLDSLGVAGASAGYPPSTGSIIVVPEPAWGFVPMAGIAALGAVWARRRARK
jgi:hypothetical protein